MLRPDRLGLQDNHVVPLGREWVETFLYEGGLAWREAWRGGSPLCFVV